MMKTYRQALILGAGLSGLGAARLLAAEGTQVTVADARPPEDLADARAQLEALGVATHFAQSTLPSGPFDVCVVSPGFAVSSEWVRMGRVLADEMIAEVELGWSRAPCPVIAITGSNGKSTAVKWCREALAQAGWRVAAVGNYGVSVCDVLATSRDWDGLVMEVSSFQLETVHAFRPRIAALLNIHPNHLDRHGSMNQYTAMKARLFAQTRAGDVCLTPQAWQASMKEISGGQGTWRTFGKEEQSNYRFDEGQVWSDGTRCADLRGTPFGTNAMADTASAVIGICASAGIALHHAETAARHYQALPHRMQAVGEVAGVRYMNDSKSTNLAAVAHALSGVDGPVHLIAGGLAKENNFECLKEVLAHRVQSVYLIGYTAEEMYSAWSCVVPCQKCGTLREALRQARELAKPGDTVLLSPGCASFDQFRNYEERGACFTEWVRAETGKGTS